MFFYRNYRDYKQDYLIFPKFSSVLAILDDEYAFFDIYIVESII